MAHRQRSSACALVCVLLLIVVSCTAQTTSSAGKVAATAAKPKLTPQQQQGLRLLQSAQAQSAALTPAMRAAVLWQVAHGYSKMDPARTVSVLKSAFRAATAAEDEHPEVKCFISPDLCHAKSWLEHEILSELVSLSPHDCEELLPQAEDSVRSSIIQALISTYVRDRKMERAEDLLRGVADDAHFPYEAASELMAALPPGNEQQRGSVFSMAVANYRTFGSAEVGIEDLGTLVIRFWQHLPPPSVMEAIDLLLKQAKENSEKNSDKNVSFSTEKGSIAFSPYEYRLFQLLPVIQQLDSTRAEGLLREHQRVADSLNKYPKGLASLYPGYRDTPMTESEQMGASYPAVSIGLTPNEQAQDAALDKWQRDVEAKQYRAQELASKDPKQALSMAMTVPLWGPMGPGKYSPRATTLASILPTMAAKDSASAAQGLTELRSVLGQLNSLHAGRIASQMADTYIKLGRFDDAEKMIAEGMKIADKLYESDTDGDDPNLALKAAWPSAGLWRKLIMTGTKVSSEYPEKLLDEIADDEIRTFEQISLANALLGTSHFAAFRSLDWRASQSHQAMVAF